MNFLAPTPGAVFATRNGNYTADANALINGVTSGLQIADLIDMGCVPLAANPFSNFRNLVDGGDFTVNPFQRNIAGLASANVISAAISNTLTYFADRFYGVGGASSAITFTKASITTLAGFGNALTFQRQASNADTAVIHTGQVVETADCYRLQGQTVTLSFWALAGSNFSSAANALGVKLYTGTGTNQSAANMIAGSWTGSATPINTTVTLTGAFQRFQVTGTIPVNATQVGFDFFYTPVGTAGANDFVQFAGIQLEIGSNASPFEFRDVQVETEICQRYAWVIAEPANGVVVGAGTTLGANAQTFYLATPVQFYKAPTLTVTTGGFKVAAGAAFATATISAGTTHTQNAISVTSAVTAAAGVGALLAGGGAGTGFIVASADF